MLALQRAVPPSFALAAAEQTAYDSGLGDVVMALKRAFLRSRRGQRPPPEKKTAEVEGRRRVLALQRAVPPSLALAAAEKTTEVEKAV